MDEKIPGPNGSIPQEEIDRANDFTVQKILNSCGERKTNSEIINKLSKTEHEGLLITHYASSELYKDESGNVNVA
jgi:hypothetical protein